MARPIATACLLSGSTPKEIQLTTVSAYGIGYGMDLYNDFTYFLENPSYGDQFLQKDRRVIVGAKAAQTWLGKFFGRDMDNTIGVQLRNDFITPVALYSTDETTYKRHRGPGRRHADQRGARMSRTARSGRTNSARSPACAGTPSTGSSMRTYPRTPRTSAPAC